MLVLVLDLPPSGKVTGSQVGKAGGGGGMGEAEQRLPRKKNHNSEDPSRSVRGITHHSIHDSKTSTPVSCIVFKESHADPYNRLTNFYFPTPAGGGTWRPARQDPEAKKSHSPGLTRRLTLCSFLATIR